VACPFFLPTGAFEDSAWSTPPRLPLGDPCRGVCRAGVDLFEPDAGTLRQYCNCGYGRHGCPRFPDGAFADAMRYSLEVEGNGRLTIRYVYERDYSPVRHGLVEFCEATEELSGDLDDSVAREQAKAFARSLSKRRVMA
jgi:hypothetical protein